MYFIIYFKNYNDTINDVNIIPQLYMFFFIIFTHFNKRVIIIILFNMYTTY